MKHPLVVLLALAFLLSIGCSTHYVPTPFAAYSRTVSPPEGSYSPEVVPVYVDKSFAMDAREDIHAALDEWNFAFNGYVTYVVVSDDFDMEVAVLEKIVRTRQGLVVLSVPDNFLEDNVPPGVLAWVDDLGDPVVHIATGRIGTRDLKKIVMHEIGHTLGIPHTQAAFTLMSQYYQVQSACIDEYTLHTLSGEDHAQAVHWDWHFMRSCRP